MEAEAQLNLFIDKYSSRVAAEARQALTFLHKRLPSATRLVYDNYNALAVGFGPSAKASEAILSIAVYPNYVSLFLLNGIALDDPNGILEGRGSKVRHIKLQPASRISNRDVLVLLDAALARASVPLPPTAEGLLIIKSISARQRPRRPSPEPQPDVRNGSKADMSKLLTVVQKRTRQTSLLTNPARK